MLNVIFYRDGMEVAIVYQRSGYMPHDFEGEKVPPLILHKFLLLIYVFHEFKQFCKDSRPKRF